MGTTIIVVLLALVVRTCAGPINMQHVDFDDSMACAISCPASSKFQYTPGMTYQYDYNVQVESTMENSYEDTAKMDIAAVVNIEVLSKCDFAMKLRDVKIVHTSHSEMELSPHFKMALERNPLRFSFHDGVIPHLCPVGDEEKWVLNFKRGVLSTFQNTMDNLERDQKTKENDVIGECSTDYKVTNRGWYSTTIKKSKDLIGCSGRHGYQSSIHAIPYTASSNIQSLPLMKSSHECEQEVDKSGFMKSVTCMEMHVFRPFSKENSGAVTKVSQKITNTGQIDGVSVTQDFVQTRVKMQFEHERYKTNDDNKHGIIAKLDEICTATVKDIRPEVPRLFSQLVYIMKNLDSETIKDIYSQILQKQICKENNRRIKTFFLDAIPMAGTSSTTRVMKEMILSKEVTDRVTKMWLMSLAFIQDPCSGILMEAKALLNHPETSALSMLPVSTLVNNYCRQHSSCADEFAVTSIVDSLLKHIEPGCNVHANNIDSVLQALRALGNVGHVITITSSLSTCFLMSTNSDEVRTAAVQAYRRLPCTADRSDVMNVFKDSTLDSELRIEAYLAIMQCPDGEIINILRQILTHETNKQVGSFVWSHITNLIESSSPHKQYLKTILKDVNLLKEFDLEKMKYSRNYEGSVFIDKFNTGAMADGNLVWSGKSFLPRSAMVNITVDLFGNSINLFEVGGRLEGLEYLLEKYLGPYGYFSEKRTKRGSAKVNLDELKASGYLRMFGNELSFLRMQGVDDIKGFNFLKFLIDLSADHDYSFTQSVVFLDSSLIIPTGCGLPLNLTVNGAATIDLKANGKIDLRKVHSSPRSLLVEGVFQPSGSIKMNGIMSVDAFVTKTGMKVVNTWHSSTAVRGRIELNRGRVFSVQLDMPQDKIEILDVKTSFFTIHGDTENTQKMLDSEKKTINVCSGSRLARLSGLELCADFSYINASLVENAPYFPFTGPFNMDISLNKRDTHTGYNMLIKRTESKTSSTLQLAFDTPSSKVDRTLAFDISVNYKKKQVDMSFVSPWKQLAVKGSLINEKTHFGASGTIIIDDVKELGFTSEVVITKKKSMLTYTPSLVIRRPDNDDIALSGSLVVDGRKKIIVDLALAGINSEAIILKTTLMNTKTEKSFKGSFGLSAKQTYSADVGLKLLDNSNKKTMLKIIPTFVIRNPTKNLLSLTGSADFRQDKSLKSSVSLTIAKYMNKPTTIRCNWRKLSGKRLRHSAALIITSRFVSVKMTGLFDKKSKGSTSRLTVDYSLPFLKHDRKNRIAFSTKFTERSTKSLFKQKYNTNLDVKNNPELNFDTTVDLSHNKRVTDLSLKIQYGKNYKDATKKITALAIIKHKLVKSSASISYLLKSQWPAKNLNVQVKGNHKHDRKYLKSTIAAKCGKGKTVDATLDLKDLSKKLIKKTVAFICSYSGNDINFMSSLIQTSNKHYQHNANLKMGKSKSSILTTYRHPKNDVYEVASDITVLSMKPIHVNGMVDLDRDDFKASGQLATRGKIYGVKSSYKYAKDSEGKCMLDIMYPDRHIIFSLDGKKMENVYETKLNAKWDADNNPKQNVMFVGKMNLTSPYDIDTAMTLKYPNRTVKLNVKTGGQSKYVTHLDCSWDASKMVSVDTTWQYERAYPIVKFSTSLELKTPFTIIDDLAINIDIANDKKKLTSKSLYTMNKKRHHLNMDFTIKKPISYKKASIIINTTSSIKGMKQSTLSITYDLNTLNCNIQSSLEKIKTELSIVGNTKYGSALRDIEGIIVFNSNIPSHEHCKFRMKYIADNTMYTMNIALEMKDKRWLCDLNMNHTLSDWKLMNSGKLLMSAPYGRVVSTWNHANTHKNVKTKINSDWGKDKIFYFHLTGDHYTDVRIKTIGNLQIRTPWTSVKNIEMDIHNELGDGFLHAISHVKKGGEKKMATDVYYFRSNGQVDFNIDVKCPLHNDISLKLNTIYNVYPVTGHVELQWSPKKSITADGSLHTESLSNIAANFRVTTPVRGYKTVVLKASNTKEGTEWISTASFEYGVRKSFKIEARMKLENIRKFWAKVETPFNNYKRLHAGIQYEMNPYVFIGKAELVGNPMIGKYAGLLHWDIETDLTCKLRLDTPIESFPYFEIEAKTTKGRKGRTSHIEIEYAPKQSFDFTSTYKLSGPVLLEVSVNTPYQEYKRMTFNFKHSFGPQRCTTHMEVSRTVNKMSSDIKLRWNKDVEGTIVIITPFEGYKSTKMSIHHNGKLYNFKNQCEVEIDGEKLIQTGVEFMHNQKTSGKLNIISSRFDDIKLMFDHRGGVANCMGSASFLHGGVPVFDASLQNHYKTHALDTEFNVRSSHFDDIRLTLDHIGDLQRFTTKLTGTMGNEKNFLLDTKFHQTNPVIDFNTLLTYTIDGKINNAGALFYKDGSISNLTTKMSVHIKEFYIKVKSALMTQSNVDASVSVQTPFKDFKNIGFSVKHSGQIDNFVAENNIQYMDDKSIRSKISFRTTGPRDVNVEAEIETPFEMYKYVTINHNHILKTHSFMSESGLNDRMIKTKADVKHLNFKHTDARVEFETPFEGYSNTILQHNHILTTDTLISTTGYNEHIIWTKISFPQLEAKNADIMMELTTPFSGYKHSVVKHKHNLEATMFTSASEYNDQSFSCVISCHHLSARQVDTKIEIHTPITGYENTMFQHMHHLMDKSLVVNTEANYGDGQRVVVDIAVYLESNVRINVAIQSPYRNLQDASLSVQQADNTYTCNGIIHLKDNKSIEGTATFSRSDSNMIESHMTLHTPFVGYEETEATCTYQLTNNALSMNGNVIYNNGKMISAEIVGQHSESFKLSSVVKTPFVGFEMSKFVLNHEGSLYKFKCHHEVEIAGTTIKNDLSVRHGDSSIVSFNMTTNIPSWKYATVSVVKVGGYRDMDCTVHLKLNEASTKGFLTTRVEKEICATSMSFSNPYTESIFVNIEHSKRSAGFTTKVSTGLGSDKHFSTYMNFINHGNMVDLNSEVSYIWSKQGNRASVRFHKEGKLNDLIVSMNCKYGYKVIEMSTELKTISGVHGKLNLKTPFTNYHNIGISFDHSGNINKFVSESRIEYMDGKEIFGKVNHYRNMWKRMESYAELYLPIVGFESTKVSYRHSSKDNSIMSNTEITYGRGQRISTDFQISILPKFDMSLIVKSPIVGYEDLELLTSYEGGWKRYILDTSLNAGNGRKFAVVSMLDYSQTPITTSFRISSPISGFETVEFTATHIGEWTNFRSTAAFKAPYTDSISSEATLKYQSLLKFDGMMALTSNIENMRNLKLTARHTDESGQQRSHIEITWDPTQVIVFDEFYKQENTWDGEQLLAEFFISTPFKIIEQSRLKIEHTRSTDKYTEKFEADYNDKTLFDMDVEYSTGVRHDASISINHPRLMTFTLIGYRTKNNLDSELILNWDKTKANCYVHTQMMYNWGKNKDFKFKIIRPSRTVGLVGSLKHLQRQTECQGELIWNEDKGQKLTYGFHLNDHSRKQNKMYDGSLEVGLPIRTVKMTGSYSNNNHVQTADGSFYWDVNRDPSKEMSVRTILYLQGATKKADVMFHLPSIKKDIKIGTEMALNDGHTIFNGKTEISYSEDSRKTLTLTTRLDDFSDDHSVKNYSIVFGVKHPFTDVDATFKSHAGHSFKKCSSSVELTYLTAKKETQNFALMMEIDSLRKQMDLQLLTPIKKINMTAEVNNVNPYQLRIWNKYDDAKAVTTNILLDTAKRLLDLTTSYDLENPDKQVHLTARYVNRSAIQVELYHKDGPNKMVDSILALRLNSSRLLHTRLHWKPEQVAEFKFCEKISMTMTEMSDTFGVELSSKYKRITMSVSEEAKPFIALLESELINIDRQLDDFRRELSLMYQANEFFIRDIGHSYTTFIDYYSSGVEYYRQNYGMVTHYMFKFFNDLARFPMNDEYQTFVHNLITKSKTSLDEIISTLSDAAQNSNAVIRDFREKTTNKFTAVQEDVTKLVNRAKNHPKLKELQELFDTTNYKTMLMSLASRTAASMKSSSIADQYSSAATRVQHLLNTGLNLALAHEDVKQIKTRSNKVYQEMLWAYKYWNVETNLVKHASIMLDTLHEVLLEEMQEYTSHFYWFQRSHITVYDLKHGEIQAEIYLPFPVNSLDSFPTFKTYFKRISGYADYYTDKMKSLRKLYSTYLWKSTNKTIATKDDFDQQLKEFKERNVAQR